IVPTGVGWYGARAPYRSGRHLTYLLAPEAMRRPSLLGQILALNVLLVTGAIFLASMAAGLDLTISDQRNQFLVLALAILLTLVVNMWLLRRRFEPLERLLTTMEQIDLSRPGRRVELDPQLAAESADVERLASAFNHMLGRLEAERRRSGELVLKGQEEERRRVARDLHDEVNQALTALLLRLEATAPHAPSELKAELAETKPLANQGVKGAVDPSRPRRPRSRVRPRRARPRARSAGVGRSKVRTRPRSPWPAPRGRDRDLSGRAGGAHERLATFRRQAHRREPRAARFARRARGRRRRQGLRLCRRGKGPRRFRNEGARAARRRHAPDRLSARAGDPRPAGGAHH